MTERMETNLLRYIWRHSRRDQVIIIILILSSLPFYFMSLELPKRIVNEAIQGRAFVDGQATALFLQLTLPLPQFLGGPVRLFDGFPLERLAYLMGLALTFLTLVIVNNGFKYNINTRKGILGERVLRRFRYELYQRLLRFRPETMRNVKPAEVATMIKDEAEPIGGFMAEAFVTPIFQLGLALTALTFILVQNVWLGMLAVGVIALQGFIIPRLRREQLRLGKMRQLASRKLAGRVGESVETMSAIQLHDTARYERADIGQRLGELFDIRFRLYKRKFAVKFLNNFLAQTTPFLFYTVGGYFALQGTLDIGQLVAVIAAYRDLPPPIKELIDWDQMRQDVTIKYEQIVEQFAADDLMPENAADTAPPPVIAGDGVLEAKGLTLRDTRGSTLLEGLNLCLPLPAHVALLGHAGDGQEHLARALARRTTPPPGHLYLLRQDVAVAPPAVLSRTLAYCNAEPAILGATIRDNVVYGLKRVPPALPAGTVARRESERTGNPTDLSGGDWLDYAAAGVSGPAEMDDRIIAVLELVGMGGDVYRFGLSGRIDPAARPDVAERLVEARAAVRQALSLGAQARLVEPFDPERFNANASVAENILFGVAVGPTFADASMATNGFVRAVLEGEGLTTRLTEMGVRIAETMVEIFQGLPAGHSLFERFSFIQADELDRFAELVARWKGRKRTEQMGADRDRLIGLALTYIEPRHRLGLLTPELQEEVLAARRTFRRLLPPDLAAAVDFYDPDRLSAAAPILDNLVFGRIAYGVSGGQERVLAIVRKVASEQGLTRDIHGIGLDFHVGQGGRALVATQRVQIDLARALIKNVPVLVLDDVLTVFSEHEAAKLLARLRELREGSSLITTMRPDQLDSLAGDRPFGQVLRFEGGRLVSEEAPPETAAAA
jgi:putative ABC transport system ATP-binding protein